MNKRYRYKGNVFIKGKTRGGIIKGRVVNGEPILIKDTQVAVPTIRGEDSGGIVVIKRKKEYDSDNIVVVKRKAEYKRPALFSNVSNK